MLGQGAWGTEPVCGPVSPAMAQDIPEAHGFQEEDLSSSKTTEKQVSYGQGEVKGHDFQTLTFQVPWSLTWTGLQRRQLCVE